MALFEMSKFVIWFIYLLHLFIYYMQAIQNKQPMQWG